MNILGIIPARMATTRFPNKPLVKINCMPTIGYIYHRAKLCQNHSDIYTATYDKEIFDYISSISGKPIMTKDTHERATNRIGEALEKVVNKEGDDTDGILIIQGDEPLLNPVLENDLKITPHPTREISQAVDAPEDIPLIEELFAHDVLNNNYA